MKLIGFKGKRQTFFAVMSLTGLLLAAACGGTQIVESETASIQEAVEVTPEKDTGDKAGRADNEENRKADTAENQKDAQVATADEMATPVEVLEEDMDPVLPDALRDGVYKVTVDSSSTMFNITACELTVADGKMTAVMTMGGTGYRYLYMGTGEEAVAASEDTYIPYVENEEGAHTFTVPVKALDAAVDCAAFSNNKEKWYDRILVFRADSLPIDAFSTARVKTVEELGLEDGLYTVDVTLEGGSGKTSVETPAGLRIEDGQAFATVIWSSKNYDYMLVDGVRFDNENPEGYSTFTIPVAGFDGKLPVVGDTTAMSTPYEIEYTLYFKADSIRKAE